MITTHPIVQEFPEYLDKIKDLYHHNEEFQVLLGSYHSLDKEIFEIEKGEIAFAECLILDYENSKTTLDMILYQGYNRQIRKMLEMTGHKVTSLKRTGHACIMLGALKKGKFRFMNNKEVDNLYKYLKNLEAKA